MKSDRVITSFIYNIILDVFYPRRCIFCNSRINIAKKYCICPDCVPNLKIQGQSVRNDGKFFEEGISALEYSGNVKEAMREFKFRGKSHLASSFAHAINLKLKDRDFIKSLSYICPVPIHPLRDREYNQSELIAKHISQKFSIPHIPDMLIKISNIRPLSTMNFAQRRRMIKSTIDFNPKYDIEGKNICLADDIYTSGSTANECARILRMYGANKVYVVSACYSVKNKPGGNKDADTDISDK